MFINDLSSIIPNYAILSTGVMIVNVNIHEHLNNRSAAIANNISCVEKGPSLIYGNHVSVFICTASQSIIMSHKNEYVVDRIPNVIWMY